MQSVDKVLQLPLILPSQIIIKNLLSSELYKIFINKLANDYKVDKKNINNIVLELIKKYSMTWKCCWSFVEIDNNGTIKKIQLFDINDIQFIKDRININK
jgi:hypothetical protein